MHRIQYNEVAVDDQSAAREREINAFDRSIHLMERASTNTGGVADASEAIAFTYKVWTVLMEDLGSDGNALPDDLRAQIISIGLWVIQELDALRKDQSKNFSNVIAVSTAIRNGLK